MKTKISTMIGLVLMSVSAALASTVGQQWEWNDTRPQEWYLNYMGDGEYAIVNVDTSQSIGSNYWYLTPDIELGGYKIRNANNSSEYLEVENASLSNGAAVLSTVPQGEDVQVWDIIPEDGQSYFYIQNVTTGKYLEPQS